MDQPNYSKDTINSSIPKADLSATNSDNWPYKIILNQSINIYSTSKTIPDSLLLRLIPENQKQFSAFYNTTDGDSITGLFFYQVSNIIFHKVIEENNDQFYQPAIRLASFADGEFGEDYVDHLKLIIAKDTIRFCNAIKGKNYLKHNPIKYYYETLNCK